MRQQVAVGKRCAAGVWRLLLLLCVLLPAIAGPWAVARAQATPPDLGSYEAWLREAFAAAQRGDRLGLEQVAPRLLETRAVRLDDGATVPVDNSWLGEALAASDPDLPLIAERLGALLDALSRPIDAAPADAQQRLRDILSRPPFAREQNSNFLESLINWFLRLLDRLLAPLDGVGAGPRNIMGWVLAGAGGALVLGVLLYWLLGLRRSLLREAHAAAADPEADLTANSALNQATTLAQSGDYRTAVRYLYLSSLLWLDEHGLLRYDRALTNREYLERLRDNAALRAQLVPIIETFDRVWYGYATLDAESFARYRQQVEGLRNVRI